MKRSDWKKYYDCRKSVKCPKCGLVVYIALYGYPQAKVVRYLQEQEIPFYLAGCMVRKDMRKSVYWCKNCNVKYDIKMKEFGK